MAWEADYDVYGACPNPHASPSTGFAVEFIEDPSAERITGNDWRRIRDASIAAAEFIDDRADSDGIARTSDIAAAVQELHKPVVVEAYTPTRRHWKDETLVKTLGWGVTSNMEDRASGNEVAVIEAVFVKPKASEHVQEMEDEDIAAAILSSLLHTHDRFAEVVIRNRPVSALTVKRLSQLGFQETPRRHAAARGHLSLVTDPYPGYEFSAPYKVNLQERLLKLYPWLNNGGSIRRWG
jgi:hypothetical protein